MSNLPRDIVDLIERMEAALARHALNGIRLHVTNRKHGMSAGTTAAEGEITGLGSIWNLNPDMMVPLTAGWQDKLRCKLEEEIRRSAEHAAASAEGHEKKLRELQADIEAARQRAEQLQRLAPDVVTELGLISEDELPADIPEPTLDDLDDVTKLED